MTPTTTPPPTTPPPTPNKFLFPKPLAAVVGESGQGKTTSYQNVDWSVTALIDCEQKGFPFNTSVIPQAHYFPCPTHTDVEQTVAQLKAGKLPHIKYVIIDSLYAYQEKVIAHCKAVKTGYDIYNLNTATIKKFVEGLKQNKLIFVVICLPELVEVIDDAGKKTNARRIKVFGKEMEGTIELAFTCIFYTQLVKGADGKMGYYFLTNNNGISSAKSPAGMFATPLIPNDLKPVLDKLALLG